MSPAKSLNLLAIQNGINALLHNCAEIGSQDRIYILSNHSTAHLGEMMLNEALTISKRAEHQIIGEFTMHGEEPGIDVCEKMFNATVIFCLTKMSMAHTKARLNANKNGVKYFSLPDYSDEVMASKALLGDFKKIKSISHKIADMLTSARMIRVTTKKGTDLTMDVTGRKANAAPGCCYDEILLASPPDAETNIAPNEFLTNGRAVIDGSIPCREIGLLYSPITLEIENGYVVKITGEKSEVLTTLFDKQNEKKFRIIAEFGIGLNKLAGLTGAMLEDEGTLGTIHLGIGSNTTIGGLNSVPFHLDHVMCDATIFIDGEVMMRDGVLIAELLKHL